MFPFVYKTLFFYGFFLSTTALSAFLLIGPKAKTALLSGGMSAGLAFVLAWLGYKGSTISLPGGMVLCFLLTMVFSWRSFKTFQVLAGLFAAGEETSQKSVAFLIISLMAVISLVVLLQLFLLLPF